MKGEDERGDEGMRKILRLMKGKSYIYLITGVIRDRMIDYIPNKSASCCNEKVTDRQRKLSYNAISK